jgi:hypothetical protein
MQVYRLLIIINFYSYLLFLTCQGHYWLLIGLMMTIACCSAYLFQVLGLSGLNWKPPPPPPPPSRREKNTETTLNSRQVIEMQPSGPNFNYKLLIFFSLEPTTLRGGGVKFQPGETIIKINILRYRTVVKVKKKFCTRRFRLFGSA